MAGGSEAETHVLLRRLADGDREAADELLPRVHDELRAIAARAMRGERAGHTLQPTALVHEAWLEVVGDDCPVFNGRSHFLAVASIAMRRFLVDHARARGREKRGGGWQRVTLDERVPDREEAFDVDVLALHEALEELERLDARQARVIELRFFGGLSIPETAEVLGVGTTTVQVDWSMARAWLTLRLRGPA